MPNWFRFIVVTLISAASCFLFGDAYVVPHADVIGLLKPPNPEAHLFWSVVWYVVVLGSGGYAGAMFVVATAANEYSALQFTADLLLCPVIGMLSFFLVVPWGIAMAILIIIVVAIFLLTIAFMLLIAVVIWEIVELFIEAGT